MMHRGKERVIGISDTPMFTEPPKPRNWEQLQEKQNEHYKNRIGKVYGDFEVVDVEYDYTRRLQKWTLKCVNCGDEKITYNGKDYVKGRSKYCHCHYEKIAEEKEKLKPKKEKKIPYSDPHWIGTEVNGMRVIGYTGHSTFLAECIKCGNQRKFPGGMFLKGEFPACGHQKREQYGESYVGQKFGNLTILKYEHGDFYVRCDCGNEKWVQPTSLIKNRTVKTCGSPNCNFHMAALRKANVYASKHRANGIQFEKQYADYLRSCGKDVELTNQSGDFGVDCIIHESDGDIAVQCKRHKEPIGVGAVQEVFSGGQYYGCNKYEVVSTAGFTPQAKVFADKLGVKLVDLDRAETNIQVNDRNIYWTIGGETKTAKEWCEQYKISKTTVMNRVNKQGMTIEEALKEDKKRHIIFVEMDGEKIKLSDLCKQYGLSVPFVTYRIKKMGMTPYEALTTPKLTSGRPKKSP